MRIHRAEFTAEGDAGSATVEGDINVNGKVYAIKLDYTDLPASTDVVLSSDGGTTEVLTRSSSNTDETFYPRVAAAKTDGTASALTEVLPAVEKLHVAVAQGDPDGVLKVTVFSE